MSVPEGFDAKQLPHVEDGPWFWWIHPGPRPDDYHVLVASLASREQPDGSVPRIARMMPVAVGADIHDLERLGVLDGLAHTLLGTLHQQLEMDRIRLQQAGVIEREMHNETRRGGIILPFDRKPGEVVH